MQRLKRMLVGQSALFLKRIAPFNKLIRQIEAVVKSVAEKRGFAAVLTKGTIDTYLIVCMA